MLLWNSGNYLVDKLRGLLCNCTIDAGDKDSPTKTKPLNFWAYPSQLSGLSRRYLWEVIGKKKLKARIIGRGVKVKRIDLLAFVQKL